MKIIRKGMFETNSSSTHSLVIPHKVDEEKYSVYDNYFHNYEYGRCESRLVDDWDEKLVYIYKMFLDTNVDKKILDNFKVNINKMYEELCIKTDYKPYKKEEKPDYIFQYVEKEEYLYITHDNTVLQALLERIEDYDFIKRLIFNKQSYLSLGGDEYRGFNLKTIGFEYDYGQDYKVQNKEGEIRPYYYEVEDKMTREEFDKRYPDDEYNIEAGEFWDKVREYEKENDVFFIS